MSEMAPWQHGFGMERLKSITALFTAQYGPYCGGAFGRPKERDVAAALRKGELCEHGGAAAICCTLKSAATHKDFTGRAIKIPAGDRVVHYLGWEEGKSPDAERLIFQIVDGATAWFMLPEENKDAIQLASNTTMQWCATKINAGGDIRGVYVGGREAAKRVDAIDALHDAELPSIKVLTPRHITEDHAKELAKEADAIEAWAQHYSGYNKRGSWQAFAVRGYSPGVPQFVIKPGEMSKKWKRENSEMLARRPEWTVIASECPLTVEIAKEFGKLDRVRFMRLAPGGGELTRHADITDRDAGTTDGKIVRLHIPLVTNPSVQFQSWGIRGESVQQRWAVGDLCYLDQRKPHCCRNDGAAARVHLVIDVQSNEKIRQLISPGAAIIRSRGKQGFGLQ